VDILWGQLGKSLNAVVQLLDSYGYEVLRSRASSNETSESAFILLLREVQVSRFKARTGPEVFRRDDAEKFLSKNANRAALSWIDDDGKPNFLFEQDPAIIDAFSALKSELSDREKSNSIGLAKQIRFELQTKFLLQDGLSVLRNRKHPWLARDVESVVSGEINW
jgi:tRNA nucleotidyltransferase (CCA-adding enzyme)